ncbi:MAG: DUF3500 domain-containing protein [Bacteroidetes bacterium]|jgi:hypothetical protein|nr:DUF3500 domain-containing protein [Bacteroidota bacterium]
MKYRFFALSFFIFGIFGSSASIAQNPSDIDQLTGSWMATQQFNEFQYRHFFHFEEGENGTQSGSSEIPARLLNAPLTNIMTDQDSVSFTIQGPGIPFQGIMNDSGNKIEGRLGRESLTFTRLREPVENAVLDNPFVESYHGITTDGSRDKDLFPIRATGVSTAPIVNSAEQFLETLSSEQRENTTFPVHSNEWRHWTNSPFLSRRGVSLRQMTDSQLEAALSMIETGLSAKGFGLARNIMRIDETVAELTENRQFFSEYLYYITVMGEPSTDEPWGWQLDGHHLVINYFVMGDQVVMTPAFFGSEPVFIDEGEYAGTEVLQEEQDKGLEFMQSLDGNHQEMAMIGNEKTEENLETAPFQDNLVME